VHGLQHLEYFFSSLLSSKEFWAAILGALIGGLLAGWFALLAQKQAAKDQRKASEEAERRAVNNLLQAIRAELTVLKTRNLDSLQKTLKGRAENRAKLPNPSYVQFPPLAMTRTEQNHFIVYESNATRLGMIDDKILLREIVAVYGLAKALVDTLNTNARDFERWRQTLDTNPEKQMVAGMLWGLEEGLRNGLETLQNDLDALLKKLEDQCASG
jgi:hypothetical protein